MGLFFFDPIFFSILFPFSFLFVFHDFFLKLGALSVEAPLQKKHGTVILARPLALGSRGCRGRSLLFSRSLTLHDTIVVYISPFSPSSAV
ncbi:hypothetical protein CABS01_02935 [Colletotrichum abscissum]|uniref:uncharacterized protein n=1 Tax=Colletotrichum abscissum TaxID=1671311 RepID=UPI0027D634D1|nr:uncharacterized protein CABS01_02935 [Colletotrichum abscissum]KAK1483199.1 hypothetical protein CABS01_02935 [Colletotrichum abscissum]